VLISVFEDSVDNGVGIVGDWVVTVDDSVENCTTLVSVLVLWTTVVAIVSMTAGTSHVLTTVLETRDCW
jgi:hypothetical protein